MPRGSSRSARRSLPLVLGSLRREALWRTTSSWRVVGGPTPPVLELLVLVARAVGLTVVALIGPALSWAERLLLLAGAVGVTAGRLLLLARLGQLLGRIVHRAIFTGPSSVYCWSSCSGSRLSLGKPRVCFRCREARQGKILHLGHASLGKLAESRVSLHLGWGEVILLLIDFTLGNIHWEELPVNEGM